METLGCQMNKLDSELVSGILTDSGYQPTDCPEKAHVAILNTCSVREHAELKALSRLGHFDYLRRTQGFPQVIGVMGCFAQRAPEEISTKAPFIDIICGPNQLPELAKLVQIAGENRKKKKRQAQVAVEDFRQIRSGSRSSPKNLDDLDTYRPIHSGEFQRFVRVQRGCDNFCSYCIVPYVRGPERSRPVDHILEEIRRIEQTGCREITLIGQTISSYRYVSDGKVVDLPELLHRVHQACSIPRIRFITSYPAGFPLDIFHAMAELPRICPYLHVPAQHGSNRVLELMNRKYTIEEYLDLLDQGRRIVPGLSIAGDFIVGFPGETEEDHLQSIALLEKVRYKNCFVFQYSPRPGTPSQRRCPDTIPAAEKSRRNTHMLQVQERISAEDNQKLIGTEVKVLVEGVSKKNRAKTPTAKQLIARTVEDKIVVFDGPESLIGRIAKVKVASATALTLFAESAMEREE